MRIRSIKPEFWRSEDIAELDWNTRLVFIGLWSYVDDNGVGRGDERLICADLFALDEPFSEASVRAHAALNTLSEHGLITRYSVNGKDFLHITTWEKHQRINRPSEARFPPPTCKDAQIHDVLTEPSLSPQNNLSAGAVEQGSRGTGEYYSSSALVPHDDPEEIRPDVDALCNRLASRIEANGANRPTVGKRWHDSARLMLDNDGHTYDQIAWLIDWSQADEFWRSNILSMPKLREKFDQLKLKSTASSDARPRHQQQTDDWYASALVRAQDAERNAS